MWAEILLENREAVSAAIQTARDSLGGVLAMIEGGDHEAVLAWLAEAQQLRRAGQTAKHDETNR
jgi:prephenate dehydrogenase